MQLRELAELGGRADRNTPRLALTATSQLGDGIPVALCKICRQEILVRFTSLLIVPSLLLACGSDDGGGASSAGGGTGGTTASGGGSGGASGGAAGSTTGGSAGVDAGGAGGSGGSGPTKVGKISIVQTITPTSTTYQADAVFPEGVGVATVTCTKQVEGTCTLKDCTMTPTDAGNPTFASAGVVTITGGAETITLTPSSDGSYPPATGQKQLFSDGTPLNFQAAGADVPAIMGGLFGAGAVTLDSPVLTSGATLDIDRSKALDVKWKGSNAGKVTVLVVRGTQQLACLFAAKDGQGSVPASLLTKLSAGSGGFSVSSGDMAEVKAGGRVVSLVVDVTGPSSDAVLK